MRSLAQSSPASKPLPNAWYRRDAITVARDLLGKGLYVLQNDGPTLVEIVETEAYLGSKDPASHAYRGPTPRNQVMFEQGGICYVYFTYGAHYCMNVVTGEKGLAEAVLLRATAPIEGWDIFRRNRPGVPDAQLMNGPGKLTRAMGINRLQNGWRFDRPDFKLLDLGHAYTSRQIGSSPRIGISKATEKLWRFSVKGSPWLSRKG